MINILLENIN